MTEGSEPLKQLLLIRKRLLSFHPYLLGHMDISANSFTIKSQRPFYPLNGVSLVPLIDHFCDLIHTYIPPCHDPSSLKVPLNLRNYRIGCLNPPSSWQGGNYLDPGWGITLTPGGELSWPHYPLK